MADVKQILVVDDHFEMLEFLRSMLETSNHDYQVLGVPSAEEGFLELRRTPFDLLITDVRLPGMSGFELARRVLAIRPDIPILMITAYSSTQGKEEAESLGIYRYFQKPLNTDALLSAVHTALYGEEEAVETGIDVVPDATGVPAPLPTEKEVRARLQGLRTDTGAAQAGLADARGRLLITVGPESSLNFPRLAQIMAGSLENNLLLAEELQSEDPLMIQYQSGERVDVYSANVGPHYFVMLFFETQARRGRIGTIWIFAQRAVKDLKKLLEAEVGPEKATPAEAGKTVPAIEPSVRVGQVRRGPVQKPASSAAPSEKRAEEPAPAPEREPEAPPVQEASPVESSAPTPAPAEPEPAPEEEALSAEFLAEIEGSELALLFEEGDVSLEEVDLDAFWETATNEEGSQTSGLSFEEARAQGLIPPEFDEPDN